MRGGHVDAISRKAVAGWAADQDRPDARLIVAITVDGVKLGQAQADRLRKDLANLGRYGDGRHGFAFEFPAPLDPGRDHTILVQFAEDGATLPNGELRLSALAAPATHALTGLPDAGQPIHVPPAHVSPVHVSPAHVSQAHVSPAPEQPAQTAAASNRHCQAMRLPKAT
jgi:hypothetical protein